MPSKTGLTNLTVNMAPIPIKITLGWQIDERMELHRQVGPFKQAQSPKSDREAGAKSQAIDHQAHSQPGRQGTEGRSPKISWVK